jgi:hypothetical protein
VNAVDAHFRISMSQFNGESARESGNGPFGQEVRAVVGVRPLDRPVSYGNDGATLRLSGHD